MNARLSAAAAATTVRRKSPHEEKYHQFDADVIAAASAARIDPEPQLELLNKVAALCAGMGVVARIIAGNCVVEDTVDPDDPNSIQPLSQVALSHLQNMIGELCEYIYEDISIAADKLRREVAA